MFRRLLLPLFLLAACGNDEATQARITIQAAVPEGSGDVYLTGSDETFGPWEADAVRMNGVGTERYAVIALDPGEELEYKFTLGDWAREAVDENGFPFQNFGLTAVDGLVVEHDIPGFKPEMTDLLDDWEGSGVLGRLVYWRDVESAFLGPIRNVEIWLPPGYDDPENAGRRYPVIYMTDGENLFDPRIANTGTDWGMDEAMMRGVEAGTFEPAIVVASWSTRDRSGEYSPWHGGPLFARFVIEELKPRVDEEFRTLTGRDSTFAMGSSMGGLMAMYLVTQHGEIFSACGCVSSHLPLSERVIAQFTGEDTTSADPTPFIERDMESGVFQIPEGARMFFDYGTETLDAQYPEPHQRLRAWLLEQGYEEGEDFLIREYPGAEHNEAAWRARVLDQLTWILAGEVPEPAGN